MSKVRINIFQLPDLFMHVQLDAKTLQTGLLIVKRYVVLTGWLE